LVLAAKSAVVAPVPMSKSRLAVVRRRRVKSAVLSWLN
jgi:hypothetical protein